MRIYGILVLIQRLAVALFELMSPMGGSILLHLVSFLAIWSIYVVRAEDPYKYYTWTVTYGRASPLGTAQQVEICEPFAVVLCFVLECFSVSSVNVCDLHRLSSSMVSFLVLLLIV